MLHKELTFQLHKTDFYAGFWKADAPKASIVLLHGMGGHLMRYIPVIENFVANNFNVISYDNFGHGRTSGKRGHNPNFSALLDVIDLNIKKVKELAPELPVFLYGHSMGGNLVINYTLRRNHNLKGVVATSPFLKLAFEPPAWKMFLGRILQKIAPSVTLGNEIDPNAISRNTNEVHEYTNDTLIHSKISPNYSITIIKTGSWAIQNAEKLKTPMFVIHGTDDKIISHKASKEFCENTNSATLHLIDGGYHELQNDICKDEFLEAVTNWLNEQV